MSKEKNIEYLEKLFGVKLKNFYRRNTLASITGDISFEGDEVAFGILNTYLDAMEKYPRQWWLSEDQIVRAYYQSQEECWLIKLDDFHEGLERLLNRDIDRVEILYNRKALAREADIAYFNYLRDKEN